MFATLDAGVGVRVTGQVQGGDWLRVDLREDGGAAFIHASLLKEAEAAPPAPLEPFGPEWSITENQPCQVWNRGKGDEFEPFTWSGACVDGKASGQGRLIYLDGAVVYEGSMQAGKWHGHGTVTWIVSSDGSHVYRYEGPFRDGHRHGRGTDSTSGGRATTCDWRDDKPVDGTCTRH